VREGGVGENIIYKERDTGIILMY